MIPLTQYKGKTVGVFGFGKTGEATIASLLAGGAHVVAWDDSEASRVKTQQKFHSVKILPVAQWPWANMPCLVMSPGISLKHPAAQLARMKNCPVVGDIELLFQACPEAIFVGITGTNGKSTTTALTAHILKEAGRKVEVGGNLGTPVLSFEPLGRDGIYVLELSSYQLDLVRTTRFRAAALLNITPDHLDRHGDMEAYTAAKMHIFDRQGEGDAAVIAVDDDITRSVAGRLRAEGAQRVVEVSASRETPGGVCVHKGILDDRLEGAQEWQADISGIVTLTGTHNWQNAATACAIARLLNVEFGTIASAMRSFPGLAHRLELVEEIGGVRFINDSKATNAEATANALAPYAHIYWIVGGKPKEGGIESLVPLFSHVTHAFLIGESAEAFSRTLAKKVPYTYSRTLDVAVKQAAEKAWKDKKSGAVVLLSPACASFDQFKNFEERGDCFRECVVRCRPKKGGHDIAPNVRRVTPGPKRHAS